MKKTLVKILSLSLCLLLCLPTLFACAPKANALSRNGIRSVLLNEKGKIELTVTLNEKKLEEYKGQKLRLFALLPGEELATLTQKEPLAEKKAAAKLTFEIDASRDGINHLYSGFAVAAEDGTFLGNTLSYLDNPEKSAPYTLPFAWAGSAKGLAASDPYLARTLGVSHTLLSIHLSLLTDGQDVCLFNGKEYHYSELYLRSLEQSALSFRKAGIQVFFKWTADPTMSEDTAAALIDLLCSRLAEDGTLGALMIAVDESVTPAAAAHLARTAHLALRSQNANGRLLLLYQKGTAEQAKAFFSFFAKEISSDPFEWGAALSPLCTLTPWEEKETSTLDLCDLEGVISHLKSSEMSLRPSYIAVSGLRFSAEDPDAQAAALAYTYRACTSLGAFAIFYDTQTDAQYGLFDSNGTSRLAAKVFSSIDVGMPEELEQKLNILTGDALSKLTPTLDRHLIAGSTALGSDGQAYAPLFDFSKNETHGFQTNGSDALPACKSSGALGRSVLFTWLKADSKTDSGVSVLLEDASALSGAFSIKTKLLLQNEDADASSVTLLLEGTNKKGERITFRATATVENDSWQSVIFYVGAFTSTADLASPVLMTLSVDSDTPDGTEYPLWLDQIDVRRPDEEPGTPNALWITLGCILGVFVICVLLYLVLLILRHRREKRARRLH